MDRILVRTGIATSIVLCCATALLAIPRPVIAATEVQITSCGVVFSGSTHAYLSADLDCSSWNGGNQAVVSFIGNGTLDLRGFTLTAPTDPATILNAAVRCSQNCTILGGGGSIVGGHWGIAGISNVRVSNTTVRGSSHRAIASNRSVRIEDVTVTDNATHAVTAGRRVVIERSSITDNGGKISPDSGELEKTSAVVFASAVRLVESTVHTNAWAGIEADRVSVRDSSVFGNGTFTECGVSRNCRFDIGSYKRVHFDNSTCDVSLDMTSCGCNGDSAVTPETDPATHNFGICAQD